MSVPTQFHLIVTSTQCVTIPRDLTSARAKRDFIKMDKIALVIVKYIFFIKPSRKHFFSSDVTNTYFPASKNPL